jgi:hypothetical protein
MKISTKRRFLVGGVGVLVVTPFIISGFRRTTLLPSVETYEVRLKGDPTVVPSGKIDVVREPITFEPLVLPSGDIRSWTLNAALSNDNKWLIVSYCFNDDDRSQICYAPLDSSGLPDTFMELESFGPKTVVRELGCSSLTKRGDGRFSYCLKKLEDGVDACSESLYYISLRQSGKKLTYSSESVLLTRREFRQKIWTNSGAGWRNHFWLEGQNAFISVQPGMQGISSLIRTDCGNVDGDKFRSLRPLVEGPVGNRSMNRVIASNLILNGKTVNFLEAPVHLRDKNEKWDPFTDSYRSVSGLIVSLDMEGMTKSEEPFPVPSYSGTMRKTLITKTHCLFSSVPSSQFFLSAALGTPQDYTRLNFSEEGTQLPDSGINFLYDPLLILPSGKHLLCACDVGRSFVDKARKQGLPLSTLGIVELPFKIG